MAARILSLSLSLSLSCATVALAQAPDEPRRAHSTHDFTDTNEEPRREVWADVKSPGGGHTYSVGTIEIEFASGASTFSGEDVDLPPAPAAPFSGATMRQVVILQVTRDDQSIAWQRYFYGNTFTGEQNFTAGTNARGISVWPVFDIDGVLNEDATRIAICGETYDRELPLSQAGSLSTWSQSNPTGFVAVYNGAGALLWTHHFFGTDPSADCAITDVSIRVEDRSAQATEIVTYCGISSHALPASTTPLSPLEPFVPLGACTSGVGGNSANGASGSQWDGIVGRLLRSQAAMSTTVPEFHSIVGGSAQDALFGLAEIDGSRFVVVGTTSDTGTTSASFPLSNQCLDASDDYCVGVVVLFDASPVTLATGPLAVQNSQPMGRVLEGVHTAARDVVVVPDVLSGLPLYHIVGSTDDADFQSTTAGNGFQNSPGGGVDGFFVTALDVVSAFVFWHGSWFGGAGDQGLTGVAAWAEFPDHVAFVGYDLASASGELTVGSVFRDTTQVTSPLVLMRTSNTGGSSVDLPAMMGATNAMTSGLAYDERLMGPPAGGGVAMGPTGRVNAVGGTDSDDYPVSGSPFVGRNFFGLVDGIRTAFDMLPVGVSRTDGTGSFAGNVIAPLPSAGNGGTTPTACLAPYGIRVGGALPDAKRMLLDYEGPAPAQNVSPAILVDRPHIDAMNFVGAVIDVGFPLSSPVVINQMETWLNSSTATTFFLSWTTGTEESLRWSLGALPGASLTISLQFVVFLNSPVPCGGSNLQTIASPALTIDY